MLEKVADTRTVCLVKVDNDLGVVTRSVDVVIDLVPISNVGKRIFSSASMQNVTLGRRALVQGI